MTRDVEIQQAVLRELAWDTRVQATEVGVEVENGVVTLVGRVDSYAKKLAAQEAAHHVSGVYDVVNDLQVHVPAQEAHSDTDLAHRVRQTLVWDVMVPDAQITSTVEDGWVTLEGQVDVWNQRAEAERAIRYLTGVRGVINRIEVTTQPITPQEIHRLIQEALERHTTRDAASIRVSVEAGKVALSGRVSSWLEKRAIIEVVSHAPGVEVVYDSLHVDPTD